MGIIDLISKPFSRTRRNDLLFGPMLYMGDHLGYWEGKAEFLPTSDVVEVFVDGSAEDDLQQQQLFFERVQQEWPILRDAIRRALGEKWQGQTPELLNELPALQFKVSSLSIPKASLEDAEWEISLTGSTEQHQPVTVLMKGLKPEDVRFDD